MSQPQTSTPEDLFADKDLRKNLKARTIRGTAMVAGGQIVNQVLNLLSLAVLGRVLAPDDFGLIAMVSTATGFASMFRDLGLSQAVIQKKQITEEQLSYLFWVNAAVGAALTLSMWSAAPLIASFYGDPRLTTVTQALSLSFMLAGLGVQHQALLKRQMRFQRIATINVIAQFLSYLIAVVLALLGFSYWALVISALVLPLVSNFLSVASLRWIPKSPRKAAGVRELLTFGGYTMLFNVVNYAGRNLDNVVIGRYAGAEALGIYNKAYNLLMLPVRLINRPVSATAVPALSRLQQQPEKFCSFYYQGVTLVALLSMPVVTSSAALAESVVLTVLGPKWIEAAEIFRILSVPAFIGTTNVVTGWVYLTLGNVRRQAISGFANSAIGIAAIVFGVRWGAHGVAWAMLVSTCIRRMPTVAYCYWETPLTQRGLFGALWRPGLSSIVAGVLTLLLHEQIKALMPAPLVVVACMPPFLLAYGGLLLLLPGGRRDLLRLKDALQILLQRNKPAKEAVVNP